MSIETPQYKVLISESPFELRKYNEYITANVIVEGASYNDATNIGFRKVAEYIFGNNKTRNKIAMISPVLQESVSEKIAMTAPVVTTKAENKYIISFIMPQKYSLKTLPIPNNKEVFILKIEAHKIAVIRFKGIVNEKMILQKTNELLEWIKGKKLKISGDFQIAQYNPPWIPWFLRRNEIMITVN